MSGWTKNAKGKSVYMIDLTCEQCGKKFEAARRDAKFCSPNCRKNNQRKADSINDLAKQIMRDVKRLKDMSEKEQNLRAKWVAQKQMKLIKDEISRL